MFLQVPTEHPHWNLNQLETVKLWLSKICLKRCKKKKKNRGKSWTPLKVKLRSDLSLNKLYKELWPITSHLFLASSSINILQPQSCCTDFLRLSWQGTATDGAEIMVFTPAKQQPAADLLIFITWKRKNWLSWLISSHPLHHQSGETAF